LERNSAVNPRAPEESNIGEVGGVGGSCVEDMRSSYGPESISRLGEGKGIASNGNAGKRVSSKRSISSEDRRPINSVLYDPFWAFIRGFGTLANSSLESPRGPNEHEVACRSGQVITTLYKCN